MLIIKLLKKVADLAFLKRCRDSCLIPSFVRISHHLWSHSSKHIFQQASLSLLRDVIKGTRSQINLLNNRLLPLHLELDNSLRPDLWIILDTSSFSRVMGRQASCILRQTKNFISLLRKRSSSSTPPIFPSSPLFPLCSSSSCSYCLASSRASSSGLSHIPLAHSLAGFSHVSQLTLAISSRSSIFPELPSICSASSLKLVSP
ncbi:hypothetical protein SUGI_0394760 [Cryptomeria japonica]|nr:hypothetical protein SUGI_0394760 [Cryptomeria japonica]